MSTQFAHLAKSLQRIRQQQKALQFSQVFTPEERHEMNVCYNRLKQIIRNKLYNIEVHNPETVL